MWNIILYIMGAIIIQFLVTLLLSVLFFMAGFAIVWPSYALRMLESSNSPLGYIITKDDANLIGSVFMLGSFLASVLVGYTSERIGRRKTAILTGLFFVLAWAIITTANTVTQIVIGRFIIGLGGGMQLVMNVIIVAETCQMSLRGALMALLMFSFNIGTLISYIEGWFCSYKVINYANLTLAVVVVILLYFLKETPYYLIRNGKEKEALNSLMFYRGEKIITQEILDELEYIRKQANNSCNIGSTNSTTYEKVKLNENDQMLENITQNPWRILLSSKLSQRSVITQTILSLSTIFMGMIGVLTYAGLLFKRAVPDISPDLCSVVLAIVSSIASALAVVITDLIPRRVLMISSSVFAAACMALLASMLRWSWAPTWGIPLMIVSFCICFQLGPANVPYVQVAECIPSQIKSLGSPIVMGCVIMANFIVLYLFEPAVRIFGLDGVFCLFSIISVVVVILTYLFMRETKNVPCEDIQSTFEEGYLYRRHKT